MNRFAGYILIFILAYAHMPCHGAEGYDSFYLGMDPEGKTAIIRDFLSEEGKLYKINADSIFVKDNPEVLEKIRKFLSHDIALDVPQVRVSLKNLQQDSEKTMESHVGVKVQPGRGSVTWSGGTATMQGTQDQVTQVVAMSGKTAEISLYKTLRELQIYRSRYLTVVVDTRLRDGVALVVKPVVQGKRVTVQLRSVYWAIINAKKSVYETGEINTTVHSIPGAWMSIGGVDKSGEKNSRVNVIQDIESRDSSRLMDIQLMTEIIELKRPSKDEAVEK